MPLMVDRRLIARFDVILLFTMMMIVALGIVTVYSATYAPGSETLSHYASRQALWGLLGMVAALAMVGFDYRRLERWAPAIYGVGLILLMAVPLVGSMGGGSRRWLSLGPMNLQPSETMKLALVILLSRYFHHNSRPGGLKLRDYGIPALYTLVPVVLILTQPDLGTASLLVFLFATMALLAGPSPRTLAIVGGTIVAMLPLIPFLYSQLKEYQQRRLTTFLNPELDPLGAGYHVIQSKIAIGSGGLWGKGFLDGTQNQLNFLPEQHTDFIFSVFSEEWGFVGAVALLSLYAILLLRGLFVVGHAKERFGALLAFGILANVFWQVIINLGMTTGLMPVVGMTLPYFSYGGSSLLTLMASMGLVINVSTRRLDRQRLPRF
ncbi:MAG: rod shape-determining protein RodA [Deltaproteobacteria bacterium]